MLRNLDYIVASLYELYQDGLKDYISEFQAFAGLPLTGQLDNKTIQLMNTPR